MLSKSCATSALPLRWNTGKLKPKIGRGLENLAASEMHRLAQASKLVAVLRGAPGLLSRRDRPAILLEYNPVTLSECGANGRSLGELLSGYALHYVDDLEGQIMSFGSPVSRIDEITWICNLFAVPLAEDSSARWASALKHAVHRLEGCNGSKHL